MGMPKAARPTVRRPCWNREARRRAPARAREVTLGPRPDGQGRREGGPDLAPGRRTRTCSRTTAETIRCESCNGLNRAVEARAIDDAARGRVDRRPPGCQRCAPAFGPASPVVVARGIGPRRVACSRSSLNRRRPDPPTCSFERGRQEATHGTHRGSRASCTQRHKRGLIAEIRVGASRVQQTETARAGASRLVC